MEIKKKTAKKKSFYFEDYTESELYDNNKTKIVKVILSRVSFLSFIFFKFDIDL